MMTTSIDIQNIKRAFCTPHAGDRYSAPFDTVAIVTDGGITRLYLPHGKGQAVADAITAPVEVTKPIAPPRATDNAELLEALDGLQQFFAMPYECSIGRFDRLADQYRRETGNWAPGKSIPDAYNDSTDCDTRRKEYDGWVQSKVDAARAAIAKARAAQ